MKKQPMLFTVKVPNDKVEGNFVSINWESKYRRTPLIKLPVPIMNIIFICQLNIKHLKQYDGLLATIK